MKKHVCIQSRFPVWKMEITPKPIVLIGTESRVGGRFFADKKGLLLPVQDFFRR